MWTAFRADLERHLDYAEDRSPLSVARILSRQGVWAVAELRFYQWVRASWPPGPVQLIGRVLAFLWQRQIEILTGISIEHGADIAPGLYIGHFGGIVVGSGVTLGSGCDVSQGVTIGVHGSGEERGSPTVGSSVYFGPGAKVFGRISVGDGARIGANAVVAKDLPPRAVAVGVPARVVRLLGE